MTTSKTATTKTPAKIAPKKKTSTPTETIYIGALTYSDVEYMSFPLVKSKFKYLYELSEELYLRDTSDLTQEEFENYKTSLTMEKTSKTDVYRITTPILVWNHPDGNNYIINGNSRIITLSKILADDEKAKIEKVPYQTISGNIPNHIVSRLQFDANDSTRPNSVTQTLRVIYTYCKQLIDGGKKRVDAQNITAKLFGVSYQQVNKAILFNETYPDALKALVRGGMPLDTVVVLKQASEATEVDHKEIIIDITKKHGGITQSSVKKWRKDYETAKKALEEAETQQLEQNLIQRQSKEEEDEKEKDDKENLPDGFVNYTELNNTDEGEGEEITLKVDKPDEFLVVVDKTVKPDGYTKAQLRVLTMALAECIEECDDTYLDVNVAHSVTSMLNDILLKIKMPKHKADELTGLINQMM